jgi:hypothetical protein
MMWYYRQDDAERGPIDEPELQALIDRGELTNYSAVREEGQAQWTSLALTPLAKLLHAYAPGPSEPESGPRRNRFGGGLTLLCLLLVVVSPLISIVSEGMLLSAVGEMVAEAPGSLVVAIITIVLNIGVTALGVWTGYRLWMIDPGAVRLVQVYLMANVLYGLLCVLIPILVDPGMKVGEDLFPFLLLALANAVFTAVVWLSYTAFAPRVKKTFGTGGD